MFIVNPNSQGGRTEKNWKKYKKIIDNQFSHPWDFKIADSIGSGMKLSEEAVKDGYTTIVGIGGEGTINEVINGAYPVNPATKFGFIRSGTSNDFLSDRVYQWPKSVEAQLRVIERGHYWKAPLTKVDADYTRYSLNLADTGISAMVSYQSSVERRLNWIKGGLRYYILALLNVYRWSNIPAEVIINDQQFNGDLTMLVAGFSKQLGDYLTLPQASLYGENMAYLIVRNFSRLKILKLMTKVKKGKHSDAIEGIDMGFTNQIEIKADQPPLFEVDGEPFSTDSTHITITAMPKSIPIIAHDNIPGNEQLEIIPKIRST